KEYNALTDARVCIYRLPNVFGKWCRPNYNSVVATFCFNISRGLDITISASNKEIELVYIDDVVESFIGHLNLVGSESRKLYYAINRSFKITLGDLVRRIHEIKDIRKTLVMPDLSDNFTKFLYATYLSYLDKDNFSYAIDTHRDERGSLVELIKSNHFGQIFVSTSQEGLMRGNYYHNSKVEKFCVIKGNAAIRFRKLNDDEVITYYVSERKMEVVDIPPGYTYSIENLAEGELIVLLWVNEVFSLEKPDTFPLNATENGGI
ncbi:MAG TPA: capsular polysaccharide biosynthesis protein CapF, partial [Metabacillus sp.]|nr:capsular polysaccharide biosynthesis protein CapF [Metabacillus sp.]